MLLLWIFHSIFVNEARNSTPPDQWRQFPRTDQWRRGWKEGPPQLWRTLMLIAPGSLALSVLLMGSTVVLGVVRWRMVLRVQGLGLSFGRALEISFVAHFFNSFLLGSTGGDLMKAFYAARETHHKKTEAVTTVVVDRLLGLWAMLLFAGMMMLPNLKLVLANAALHASSALILAMLTGCTVIGFVAFWGGVSKRWTGAREWLRRLPKGDYLERSLDACRRFGKEHFFVTRTLSVSMLLNTMCVLQLLVLSRGLGLDVSPLALFAIVPVVICISALPITPSGLGVRENLFVHMLSWPISVDPTKALSLSLLAYAGSLFWSLVGGMVYLTLKRKHHLAERELVTPNDT
jgi:hypothetical protein